jgi:fimbrial isopeptide formation D2 family protein
VYIYYGNKGSDTTNGTLTFTYDSDLTFVSANNNPASHNTTTRTITWNLATIAPNSGNSVYQNYVSVNFLTPIGTPIGTAINSAAHITGTLPDCDTTDNHDTDTRFVTNSYDPNEKQVLPAGDIQEEDSVLTYTIHFQNTGNDTAWFVVLKDTLSAHLDPGTIENIGWSHPITEFKVEGEGALTWVFNPIYLVDSATNPEGSKGYVTFRIKKKAGLPLNTEIKNTASIYFDYNEAIVTNTVSSKLTDPNSIYNLTNNNSITVTAAPNPFTNATLISVEGVTTAYNFQLFDVSGKLLKNMASLTDSRFVLPRDNMSPGVYFYSITTASQQKVFGRLVVQ